MTYAEIVATPRESTETRRGRAYIALCAQAVRIGELEQAAQRATAAADVPMQSWGAWHALSVVADRLATCPCEPCRTARGEK